MAEAGRARASRLIRWSLAYAVACLVLWPIEVVVGERFWPAMALLYAPQVFFLVPALVLLVVAAITRERRAFGVNAMGGAFVVFVLMGLQPRCDSTGAAADLTVLCFNVEHGLKGKEKVAKVLADSNADVILLQEASITNEPAKMHPALQNALKNYELYCGKHLLIATRFPILGRASHYLGPEADRLAQEVTISVKGVRIRIYNMHLQPSHAASVILEEPSRFASHLSGVAVARRMQVSAFRALVESHKDATIVAGDLNGPARGPLYAELSEGLTNAFTASGSGFGYSLTASIPAMRVDHILSRGLKPVSCEVLNVRAADHRPVLARFRLAENPTLP